MPRWCNGSHAGLRSQWRDPCRFESDLGHQFKRSIAMSAKETLERAYCNVPKEPVVMFDMSWIPTYRGVKYYWIKLIRSFTR